ncbi:hypothetical protein PRIPAC_70082 [Pristionchus pacificus]|uniref:Uncharacterized protein n=1 Tax=Pristionchus pacificus TaxID=54126 RepID=A0A2A6BGK1_PRIPA|nr:hypothetical protein PRIPAC_70082 [Pristionchus pacificus]|eukprot:PDM64983.1 hypothetical protein PRIPAC_53239 [Pristionchus pacificus]
MDAKSILRPKVIIPAVIVIVVIVVVALVAVFFLRNPSAADDLLATMGGTTTETPDFHTTGPGIQSSFDTSDSPRSFPSASASSPSSTTSSHDHTIHSLSTQSIDNSTTPSRIRRR